MLFLFIVAFVVFLRTLVRCGCFLNRQKYCAVLTAIYSKSFQLLPRWAWAMARIALLNLFRWTRATLRIALINFYSNSLRLVPTSRSLS